VLVGYVSDEYYLAISDVAVLIQSESLPQPVQIHSAANGGLYAEIEPGEYGVTLSKTGFGSKSVLVNLDEQQPIQFRLLSDKPLGYVWPKRSKPGEQAEWRVHTTEAYKLGLWRYGHQKEFIKNLGWYDEHAPLPSVQVLPDGDFTQTGAQWNKTGYTMVWHKQLVTAPEKSGLYYLHMKTESGKFYSFPWIISPSEPQSEIAVLTSDITWNAYNNFGGRSNYVNQDGLPEAPIVNSRQELHRYNSPDTWPYTETAAPLSFDRPDPKSFVPENMEIADQIEGRSASAHAPGEWRLLGWMEREGFEYDLYSEIDLHFDQFPLERYKVLVLNNHPEYWSPAMFARVKKWVYEEGGRLVNLSGCGFYAEVEFPDEDTMLCRREGYWELRTDPTAELLGVEYTHGGFNSGAPYEVLDASHWSFSETGLNNGDSFGEKCQMERCSGGASALELDKITENSPSNLIHLARGLNGADENNGEGAGGDMVFFETTGGGQVFSSGSLGWPLSLLVDNNVSKITKNVLSRFLS